MLAIIAGAGRLPAILAAREPEALLCAVEGFAPKSPGRMPDLEFRVERLVPFMSELSARGVTRLCFAGAVHRPALDPSAFDADTAALAPRFLAAMQGGDDATLRFVLSLFEERGFAVVAAQEIAPELLPAAGVLTAAHPDETARADARRASEVTGCLGQVDIGQGCAVQQGQVLAVEALPGTDWMLARLAESPFPARPDPARGRGLFFKAPKPGQDRRVDLPAIGPGTAASVAAAGLGGIVAEAGGVMVLDREETVAACDAAGLFLWLREPG